MTKERLYSVRYYRGSGRETCYSHSTTQKISDSEIRRVYDIIEKAYAGNRFDRIDEQYYLLVDGFVIIQDESSRDLEFIADSASVVRGAVEKFGLPFKAFRKSSGNSCDKFILVTKVTP